VHAAGRYTSQGVLDAEARLVNATRTPTAAGLSRPSAAAPLDGFEAVARVSLDAGQRGPVTAFACDSRLLLAGIGPARSGTTTAMRALEYALRAGGQRLVPLATSAASADVLGRELGVRAENLHKFMHKWTRGPSAARLQVRYDPRQYAAREILLNVLASEGAPLSATETISVAQEEAGSLSTLVPCYLHAAHEDAAARYRAAAVTALGANGGRALADDPAPVHESGRQQRLEAPPCHTPTRERAPHPKPA
jgi:AAA domain